MTCVVFQLFIFEYSVMDPLIEIWKSFVTTRLTFNSLIDVFITVDIFLHSFICYIFIVFKSYGLQLFISNISGLQTHHQNKTPHPVIKWLIWSWSSLNISDDCRHFITLFYSLNSHICMFSKSMLVFVLSLLLIHMEQQAHKDQPQPQWKVFHLLSCGAMLQNGVFICHVTLRTW